MKTCNCNSTIPNVHDSWCAIFDHLIDKTQMNEPNHTSECQCALCSAKRLNNVNEPSFEEVERVKGLIQALGWPTQDQLAHWHLKTLAETVEPLKARNEHLEKLSCWWQCEYALKVKERDTALAKLNVCNEALEFIYHQTEEIEIERSAKKAISKLNEGK